MQFIDFEPMCIDDKSCFVVCFLSTYIVHWHLTWKAVNVYAEVIRNKWWWWMMMFMHVTYHRRIQVPKEGRHCWPPTFSTLAPPMDAKYYCNRFIAFHCHSSRKFRTRLASIAVANSDLFCIFAPPYSMTCIRLWFLNFPKVTNICE